MFLSEKPQFSQKMYTSCSFIWKYSYYTIHISCTAPETKWKFKGNVHQSHLKPDMEFCWPLLEKENNFTLEIGRHLTVFIYCLTRFQYIETMDLFKINVAIELKYLEKLKPETNLVFKCFRINSSRFKGWGWHDRVTCKLHF